MVEGPVCGSPNASLAHWLPGVGAMRLRYDVHQGTALGRAGRLRISAHDDAIWITGTTRTLIEGTLGDPNRPNSRFADVRASMTRNSPPHL
jgi:predicted PhzF superfamily epimerase YddE/YHI9